MASKRLVPRALSSTLVAILVSAACLSAQNSSSGGSRTPQTFGVDDYNVTVISATNFTPYSSNTFYLTSGSFGRGGAPNTVTDWYAGLELPAGAAVDWVGLNSITDTDGAFGVDLVYRDKSGTTLVSASVQSTVHGWDTDFNSTPISKTWDAVSGEELVLHVQQASLPTSQFFGWVEVWWKRSVSPAPGFATFNDVPTNHPFFQYVEALAASGVTGGCGNGNYCPDAPLTRGQMAVFLAKALGLHWPGATAPPAAHQ